MDELEEALEEYLRTNLAVGELVTMRSLRNDVAPRFVSGDLLLSDVLADIQRFVRRKISETVLRRERPGVYTYWPEGGPAPEQTNPRAPESLGRATAFPSVVPLPRDAASLPFDSVASLAGSSEFLILRGWADIDIAALQGMSF